MSPDPASNIRVFIRWHDQTVFAGEEVKCRITFKNVAQSPNAASSSSAKSSPHSARQPTSDRSRQASALHGLNRNKPSSGLAPPAAARGHRSTLSLSVPSARTSRNRSDSIPWPPQNAHDANSSSNGGHRRSVSIVSIASASTADGRPPSAGGPPKPYRPTRGHARASSLQIVPRAGPLPNGPRSASHPHRPFSSQPSPLLTASYPPDRHALYSNNTSGPSSSRLGSNRNSPRLGSQPVPDFKFPMSPASPADGRRDSLKPYDDSLISPSSSGGDLQHMPIRTRDQQVPTINEHNATPAARVLSTTSIAGTPRSSGEFYSVSNNSTETLASEYVLQQPHRAQGRSPHLRQRSNLSGQRTRPEALMMGYAQVHGSFTLDGSLIDLAPFGQVKRKAVVGGQGGGVIGVEPSARRDSGLLRSFGWSSFTSSIGELLGAGELSSIKEMRGIASSKSVPLLSTPQSILFVDLQLAPGESKTYEYSFKLPKGLPPTHKGKAMKIAYSLVIGTQRPGGAKEQQVKSVEVPFRVLGSVNSYGEILGHDLMSPYILLRDQAKIQSIDKSALVEDKTRKSAPSSESTVNGFLSYVDELLNQRDAGGMAGGLLSPTAMPSSRRPSAFEESTTAREAIDLAILRSNMTAEGQQSANRFEIARNGRRVGVVMLARPSYRVGETVTMAVDFSGAEVPCYAVHAALETAERVDPSLALRSEASVHRVTRKVYVSSSEATLFARRAVFSPTIPVSATPEFVTSGVSLEWKIRLEFVVPTNPERMVQNPGNEAEAEDEDEDEEYDGSGEQQHAGGAGGGGGTAAAAATAQSERKLLSPPSSGGGGGSQPHHLLEEISHDDRGGLVLVAAENLICESFEVAVPLRVYGAVTTGLERLERDEALEEGLVV